MNPVRTREDCINWLTLEEVDQEVFAAFVGAQQHARKFDFDAYEKEAWPNDPGAGVRPGTVLLNGGGEVWDRWQFLEYLAVGIVWRLQAMAERKGVDLQHVDVASALGSPSFHEKGFEHPYWSYLGGEVKTITDAELEALPKAQRDALLKSARTGKPVVAGL